jgi:hypothetical protein
MAQPQGQPPQPGQYLSPGYVPPQVHARASNRERNIVIAVVCGLLALGLLGGGALFAVKYVFGEPSHHVTYWMRTTGGNDTAKLRITYFDHDDVIVPSNAGWQDELQTSRGTSDLILLILIDRNSQYPDGFLLTCGINVDGVAMYVSRPSVACSGEVKLPGTPVAPSS